MVDHEPICEELEIFGIPAGEYAPQDTGVGPAGCELSNSDLDVLERPSGSGATGGDTSSQWGSGLRSDLEFFGSPMGGEAAGPAGFNAGRADGSCLELELFERQGEADTQFGESSADVVAHSVCPELELFVRPAEEAVQGEVETEAGGKPSVPTVRVCGFDSARVEFSEDLQPRLVSPAGACLSLDHEVYADDTLRVINLDNYFEADFRVVGPTRMDGARVAEWAVEPVQKGRCIWGRAVPTGASQPSSEEQGTNLACRSCQQETLHPVTPMETEALNSTGIIAMNCDRCQTATYWAYADASRRPAAFPPFPAVAPPPRVERVKKFVNTRAHKRLKLYLPILVRSQQGKEEIARTENVSIGGLAVILSLDLTEGETVTYVCPYGGADMIEQQAECRWSAPASPGGVQRIYGFRRIS